MPSGLQRQRGMALLVTLVLVALLALLTFSGSETTRLQQRLATNDQASQVAFQAAEAALREALETLQSAPQLASFCQGVGNRYTIDTTAALNDDDIDTALALSVEVSETFMLGDGTITLAKQPRYVIACIDAGAIEGYTPPQSLVEGQAETGQDDFHFFRIYAQGFGPRGQISRLIEARYAFQE